MAAAQSPVLEPLIANQRAVHQGQPGGLGQAMTVAEREAALLFCQRNKPEKMRHPCTLAPDQAGAHDAVVLYIIRPMTRLIASKWYYKEYEDLAMDWVEDQFAERAADTWRRVTAVTKRTATTSGIGPNSVLYRSLRDMLHAYPAHGVKNHIMARKSKELVWTPTKTVVEIHSAFMAYYEAYDRAVALTAGIVDVTLVVPAQDWATRFTEMQSHFPSWVTTLIIDYPGRFADMESCWAAIIAEASRQATSRKIGNGGRILQLTNEAMTAGELEGGLGESGVLFNDDVDVAYTDTSGISIFALGRQQVPGCWRCGDKNHLRRDCTLASSKAELEGAPMNQWAKMPRVASSVAPQQAPFPSAARGSATSTTTVLAQMAALNARIDRQDTMFETILQRLPPLTPLPGVPMAAGALAQMAVPTAAVEAAPLIMGGPPPVSYVYVGANQGLSIWGHNEIVAASIMQGGEVGNCGRV
jgi:hypothetical protein